MNAIPSSESSEQSKESAQTGFSKMFDNTEKYDGEMIMDVAAGSVEKCFEKLHCEWIAIDPGTQEDENKEPAALKMTASRFFSIEKLD